MKNEPLEVRLNRAQNGDTTELISLLEEYRPLIKKYSYVDHVFNEDLFSELQLAAYLCIRRFKVNPEDWQAFLEEVKELL